MEIYHHYPKPSSRKDITNGINQPFEAKVNFPTWSNHAEIPVRPVKQIAGKYLQINAVRVAGRYANRELAFG
jgi:hypothetical protein